MENLEEKAVDRLHKPQKVISSPIRIASRDASSSESANRWSSTTAH